jgi:hypothetical protein
MILFLDDNPTRRSRFRSAVLTAVCVDTAEEAIRVLADMHRDGGPVEHLYLDHDLGGEEFVASERVDTGMEVVRWIGRFRPVIWEITVHSCNKDASVEMWQRLTAAGYACERIPFPNLIDMLNKE